MTQQQLSVQRESDCQYSFLLSGFRDHEKTTLARQIIQLGGNYIDCKEFSLDCTHVVCIRPMRSEKFLCGCASGRWVVTPDFIHDSTAAGCWLEETSYVWDNETSDDSNCSITSASMVNAPKRWREHLELMNLRAFEGWNVAILVDKNKNRPAVYKRLIESGGGNVLSLRSPTKNLESLSKTLNYIFMDKSYLEKVGPLLAAGVPCLAPDFIAEYLFEESPDTEKYDIRKYEPNQRNSLPCRAESSKSSPPQGRPENLVPTTPSTTRRPVKPKPYPKSQPPTPLLALSPSQGQASDSQSQSAETSSKHQSPSTKSPAAPSFTQSKTSDLGTCVKHTTRSQDPSIAVNSETFVKKKLFSSHQVQKTVEEVQKRYSPSYYSLVPDWIQVKPTKYQDKEEVTMPFPTMVCNLIDAYLEEGLWLRAVESIHSYLSVKKYPPSSLLHIIMSKVLELKDVAFTSQAINVLKSVLCIHRPSTPEMSQVYLESFVPSDNELFGLESDDPINTPWDFIGSVIRKSLQLPLGELEEDVKEQEQAQLSVLRNNHQMLLSYIVDLVEQDFQVWVHRRENATTNEQRSCHCMLSSILWPDGNVKASSPFATQLISFMLQAVAAIGSASHMYPCLRMIISLVEMAAETCRVITGGSCIMGHAETGVHLDFVIEVASMLSQEGLMENMESLNVLLTLLRPDWLKLKVVESLLCAYDDSLVREDFRDLVAQPLSLKKVVNYYFYLLPLMGTASLTARTPEKQNQPIITTSRKRPHQDTIQAGPLKTLGTKRNISDLQTCKEGPNSKAPKMNINKVNRRNIKGETPLHLACIKNNVEEVRELLSNPAIEINQEDYSGWTALHEAANHGHVDCVKELLKYKPKATISSNFSPDKDKTSVNALNLLAAPADCGTTPLHDAVNNGHVEVARLLVKAGGKAVLMARNTEGFTPLDLADNNTMRRALDFSTKRETETTMPSKDHNKGNVMDSESQKIHQMSTLSPPPRHSSKVGIPSEEKCTPELRSSSKSKLDKQAESNNSERPNSKAPKMKINKVNRKNPKGETPLHLACIKNNAVKVRELLSNPAIEINQVDAAGWTALHEAANHGHVDCVKELLKYKPKATISSNFSPDKDKTSVNALNLLAAPAECGTTPLHDAVNNGHVEVARLLVKAGGKAVLMARNNAGFTPLDLAIDNTMRRALDLSTKTESESTMPDPDSHTIHQRSMPSPPPRHLSDIGIPSEEEYIRVLGSSNGPKFYIPAERCEQLCLLVCHLLRACLRVHKLVPIKADLDSQHVSVTDGGSCKANSQASVRYEMKASGSIEGAFPGRSMWISGSRLLDDLTEMCRLDGHIDGFVHHIGRIGPWVGSQPSKICNTVVCELKALADTCL